MSATCWRCRGPLDPRQDDVLMTCTECGRRWPATSSDLATLRHHAEGLVRLIEAEITLLRAWARESREGGWSTHQVDPMLRRAADLEQALQAWREGPGKKGGGNG